jgi:hypothetical protein
MMRFAVTLLVLKLSFVVLWVLVALLRGVLALWPVHQAWLERLVAAIRGSLVIPLLVAFVVGVTTIAVTVILSLVVVTMVLVVPLVVTTNTSVMLFCHMADLLIAPLAKFVMHLASHALFNLTFAFFAREPSATCKLKMFLKYSASDSSLSLLRRQPPSTYFALSYLWKDI